MLSGSRLSIRMFDLSLGDHSVVLPAPKNELSVKVPWVCFTVVGVGQSLIPFSFPGSIEILPSSITSPKYSTFVWLNLHLVGFRNRSLSHKHVRAFLVMSFHLVQRGKYHPCIWSQCSHWSYLQKCHPSLLGMSLVSYIFQRTSLLVQEVLCLFWRLLSIGPHLWSWHYCIPIEHPI